MNLITSLSTVDVAVDAMALVVMLVAMRRGFYTGIYGSVIEGVAWLTGTLLVLWLSQGLSRWLMLVGLPQSFALIIAFVALVVAPFAGLQYGRQRSSVFHSIRVDPAFDRIGGVVVATLSGLLLAAVVQVAWSVSPAVSQVGFTPEARSFDAGRRLLVALAKCIEGRGDRMDIVLDGEPIQGVRRRSRGVDGNTLQGAKGAPRLATETFLDRNGNGQPDPAEPYLDADGNERFSESLTYIDVNGNGKRDIGLLERYVLGHWDRVIVLGDPPRPAEGNR